MQDSHHPRGAWWILAASSVTYRNRLNDHGNPLPNRRMQDRLATGVGRAAIVRAALYAVAGKRLRGDAAGDGAGQYRARASTRDYAIHYRERGEVGASGYQRVAAYG